MKIEKHKYIKLLEYAISQTSSYHMEPGLREANMTEREFLYIRDSIFINANTQAPPPNIYEVFDWKLKPEAIFGYLSFKQYEQAQGSSSKAFYISTASLVVAILTLAATIFSFAK